MTDPGMIIISKGGESSGAALLDTDLKTSLFIGALFLLSTAGLWSAVYYICQALKLGG